MSSNYEHSPEEQRAFISLVTQYQPSLRAYIISLMPGMDGAADVLQETNLIIWEKRKSFEVGSNFVAWAYTIARFEVKRHKRQYSKQKSKVCTLDDDLAEELAEFCSLIPEETEKRMLALERCLSKLSKEELHLIQQRYVSDLSLKEYAEKVGRPFGSLRVTLHRIRSGLRQCVAYQLNPNLGSR